MDVKKINFRQPKYMLPAILYPVLIGAGYPFMRFFDLDTGDATDPRLKTTEYLSSDLPEAHTDSILEDKMNASQDMYGNISDLSGVNSVENDNDSIQKKEGYDSKYSESEAAAVERQQQQYKEELELRKMQNQVRENRSSGVTSRETIHPRHPVPHVLAAQTHRHLPMVTERRPSTPRREAEPRALAAILPMETVAARLQVAMAEPPVDLARVARTSRARLPRRQGRPPRISTP